MTTATSKTTSPVPAPTWAEIAYGSNTIRLSWWQWLVVLLLVALCYQLLPRAAAWLEPLKIPLNGRIPYAMSNDYWLYSRYSTAAMESGRIPIIGDSVMWGHFVTPDKTFSGHLNRILGQPRFANVALDGAHPVAMEGLLQNYGGAIRNTPVILHCNFLWLSSKKHDLQTTKEFAFNHPRLVPQFRPWIACYKEGFSKRISIVLERQADLYSVANHWLIQGYDSLPIHNWTIAHPGEKAFVLSTRGKAASMEEEQSFISDESWEAKGTPRFSPAWVDMESSLQWKFFQRCVKLLKARHNTVFVIVGPFNEHMLTEASRAEYRDRVATVKAWLEQEGIPHWIPPVLSSELYGDASHPVSKGYETLAAGLLSEPSFRAVLDKHEHLQQAKRKE